MSFSEDLLKYFGTKDLYAVLHIEKTASTNEVRKAYYKLSLVYHPDRVLEEEKAGANEKFKVLYRVNSILSDPEKRTIYDETGMMGDDNEDFAAQAQDWMKYWRTIFSGVSFDDLDEYEAIYTGSQEELVDLKNAYEKCKGDMDKISQYVMFMKPENEGRIRDLIQGLIDRGEVPAYDSFTKESQEKRDRRLRKMMKEAKEAEKMKTEKEGEGLADLQKAILGKKQQQPESFLDALEKKYAGPKMSGKTYKKSSRGKKK